MSQQNVETLKAVYAAFNEGQGIDVDLLTPDVEFTQPEIGESTYFGREGVVRGVQELLDVFENVQAVPEEFFVAEPHIVVFVRLSGRAKGSGVPVEFPLAHVFRFRGELVDQWHAYPDRAEALEAVGLEE
jgi:ketosteroid isomerase-like protein